MKHKVTIFANLLKVISKSKRPLVVTLVVASLVSFVCGLKVGQEVDIDTALLLESALEVIQFNVNNYN